MEGRFLRRIGAAGGGRARLKSHVKTAAAAFMVMCSIGAASPAETLPRGRVTAELTGIAHLHSCKYSVEITVTNRSASPIDLADREVFFSVQSDILGRWIELAWRRVTGQASIDNSVLSPGEERKITVILTLPAGLPHLYRNHEGDVNMRFQYTFACPGAAGLVDRDCAGESTYWLTPGTDRWVLREGM